MIRPAFADSAAARAPLAPVAKAQRRPLHGVLLLDKPIGMTSTQALGRAKRLFAPLKAGHTGTLDPLASGLLPLCFGAATKFAQAGLDADKAYLAGVRLGQTRRGGDLEGEVLQERAWGHVDAAALEAALARLTGPITQTPPMQSALKHAGKPLYEWARQGQEIERPARAVTVHQWSVVAADFPNLLLRVRCSKGTYVRSLAESLGELLGCGAHLSSLRREASGPLALSDAWNFEALEALAPDERAARCLLPVDALLGEQPKLLLSAAEAAAFLCGQRTRPAGASAADAALLRVYGPAAGAGAGQGGAAPLFLGSGHTKAGELIATRLLSPIEIREAEGLAAAQVPPRERPPDRPV